MIRTAIAGILALFVATSAIAQTFPTVPAQSVIGRLGVPGTTGPSQAIQMATLAPQLIAGANVRVTNPTTAVSFPSFDATLPSYRTVFGATATWTGDMSLACCAFVGQTVVEDTATNVVETQGIYGGAAIKKSGIPGAYGVTGVVYNYSTATVPSGSGLFGIVRGELSTVAGASVTGVTGVRSVSEVVDGQHPNAGYFVYNSTATNAFNVGYYCPSAANDCFRVGYGSGSGANTIMPTYAFSLYSPSDARIYSVAGATGDVATTGTITADNSIISHGSNKGFSSIDGTVNAFFGASTGFLTNSAAIGTITNHPIAFFQNNALVGSISTGGIWNIGLTGTLKGQMGFSGNTSGTVTVMPQAVAGTATFTLPNTSGTPAISVPSPLSLSATTGAVTWAGLTSGGVLYASGTTSVASSAALASGALVQGGGAGAAPSTFTLGGDCTFSTPNITCTKTGGAAFTSLATAAVGQIPGETSTGSAGTGKVGEYLTGTGSAVAITSATQTNAASVPLTAGDWDVECTIKMNTAASTTVVSWAVSINTTSATLDTSVGKAKEVVYPGAATPGAAFTITETSPMVRISTSGTPTAYCVAYVTYATSTLTVDGFIRARRAR